MITYKAAKKKAVIPCSEISVTNNGAGQRSDHNFFCNILILDDNRTKVCFLMLDSALIEFISPDSIRYKTAKATDIVAGNIIIWNSETDSCDKPEPGILNKKGNINPEDLADKIVEEIKTTNKNFVHIVLETGKKTITDNKNTDDSVNREVIILSAREPGGKLFALLLNYDCHLALYWSKEETLKENKDKEVHIEDAITNSTAIEGRIRSVSERISVPQNDMSISEIDSQGIAIHNFALIAVPAILDRSKENKIRELSPYENTMVLSLTSGVKMVYGNIQIIINLIGENIISNLSKQSIKRMERKASDNKYLHRDFHISMNLLMNYIYDNFGKEALIKYLKQYSGAYYKPLNQKLKTGDKEALIEYFRDIYEKEEWPVNIITKGNTIEITQDACPGITHIRSKGWKPCPCYRETYNTVYKTLCEGTPFEYILENFNEETGACKQIFVIRR